jgi:hypothetical protein
MPKEPPDETKIGVGGGRSPRAPDDDTRFRQESVAYSARGPGGGGGCILVVAALAAIGFGVWWFFFR